MDRPQPVEAAWTMSDSSDSETTRRVSMEEATSKGTCKRTITAEFQLSSEEHQSSIIPFAPTRTGTASSLFATVAIRLSDNHVIHCRLYENDSLEGLIDALRRNGKVFRVDDVILRGFSLINWKQQSLEAIGVRGGDEIHIIEEKQSRKVTVRIESMDQEVVVQVDRGKNCWKEIRKLLSLPSKMHFNVMVQEGLHYRRNHEWRRAVSDYTKDGPVHFDEDNGEAIYDAKKFLHVVEFLTPKQGLRAAPRGHPRLILYDAILGWENDHIVPLNPTAPFNHNYIACVRGFHCRSEEGSSLFLQNVVNNYVECLSGTKEFSLEKLYDYHRSEGLTQQAVCLLLRENGRIPQWNSDSTEHFALFRRDGVELKIIKGRIFRATPRSFVEGTSSWIMRSSETCFDKDFNREVLRRKKKYSAKSLGY